MKKITFPTQPIIDGRFVGNRIVETLFGYSSLDLNDIAKMDFTEEERVQFAQLIGYSLRGFGSLSYVSDEAYGVSERVAEGESEEQARIEALRVQLEGAREGVRLAATSLFRIHPDDLS